MFNINMIAYFPMQLEKLVDLQCRFAFLDLFFSFVIGSSLTGFSQVNSGSESLWFHTVYWPFSVSITVYLKNYLMLWLW